MYSAGKSTIEREEGAAVRPALLLLLRVRPEPVARIGKHAGRVLRQLVRQLVVHAIVQLPG